MTNCTATLHQKIKESPAQTPEHLERKKCEKMYD